MGKVKQMTGLRFGRITVGKFLGMDNPKRGEAVWECLCDCGASTSVRGSSLRRGLTTSCGCFGKENAGKSSITHGHTRGGDSDTYKTWLSMNKRCREGQRSYENISVCNEWSGANGFQQFLSDMGLRPEDKTLDRTDPKGDYHKDNCRWADIYLQAQNQKKANNNTSGRTGVYFREERKSNPWVVTINKEGKRINVGSYPTFEDACTARESAELLYFGFIKE